MSNRAASSGNRRLVRRSVRVELTCVEFARATDGLLRGKPEPVLLFGCYALAERGVELVGRAAVRLGPSGAVPRSEPCDCKLAAFRFRPSPGDAVVLLAIAIEDDGGGDVESLYARLPHAGAFRLWSAGAVVPSPLSLEEIVRAQAPDPPAPSRSNLVVDGKDARDRVREDDFVGACFVRFPVDGASDETFRLPFSCDEPPNDWTAVVRARVS
jgi:hypothetical protein